MSVPYIILAAGLICLAIFVGSHLFWVFHGSRKKTVVPIFWERPVATIAVLFMVFYLTRWDIEIFALSLVGFYLVGLTISTIYLHRKFMKNTEAEK